VPDDLLVARVRARLGRVCSHPRAIDVGAHDGRITLRGPTLVNEVNGLLAAAASVRGVNAVQNDLEIHEHPHGIPALQGEGQRVMPSLDRLRRNWAPATAGVVSAGLLATGLWIALSRWRGSGTPEHAGAVI
jgi:uncharacterized protein YwbE